MKIMVVEDDMVSMALLKKALNKINATVVTATTGLEALELLVSEQPRIVITDWMMPELDGLELCRRIRENHSDPYKYVIITTGKNEKKDLLEAFSAGADDFICKPYDIRELYARLNTGKRIIRLEDKYKTLQETLIHSRNKIRTTFDALPEEILSVDTKLRVVSMNQTLLNNSSGRFKDYHESPCDLLTEDGDSDFYRQQVKAKSQACIESGEGQVYLDRYIGSDAKERVKERSVIPIKDDNDEVFQITFMSRDITEEFRQNEEVKRLNKKLKVLSSELIQKNGKLENALENLERTQTQMLQSEKMASIGQLAAGVAHEINNPTGFVSSNLKTLGDYLDDIMRLISDYQEMKTVLTGLPAGQLPEAHIALIKKVSATEEDIDIDFIREDSTGLIEESREGTERIKKIVDDLKHFAHPGEEKMKATDINAGLESTLNVVNNELKYKATIVKEFGDLPMILAYPQQLNQVFMNILVNSAQAIEKSGEIKIVTATAEEKIVVRISDTGCGIAEENLNKIFDPFFTTKDVGKGTGLGMNIAYNIINKHHGSIRAESTVGEGTTFIIELPCKEQQDSAEPATDDQALSA
jgi:signal transduction histidine kinase/DNA-binding response OmpR family regulator